MSRGEKGLKPTLFKKKKVPEEQYNLFELYGNSKLDEIGPDFFFLRLPIGQHGPVSQLSCPQLENEAVQVHLIGAEPIVQVKK